MRKNILSYSISNVILFSVVLALVFIESIFNILGLWVPWNLFGYLMGLLLLPILNIWALISAVSSVISFHSHKKANDNTLKKYCYLPVLFFAMGLFITIIAYIFVFTWGFGIMY